MNDTQPTNVNQGRNSRVSRFGRYALLVGFSNLVFASAIAFSTNYPSFWSAVNFFKPVNHTIAVEKSDLLAVSRLQRGDNEMMASLAMIPLKTGLNLTRVVRGAVTVLGAAELVPDSNYPMSEVTSGPETPGTDTYSLDEQDPIVEASASASGVSDKATPPARQKVAPLLFKDKSTGRLQIGNFKSMTMAGGMDECLGLGQSMLGDIGTSTKRLDVMASSKQITIAKICANNGVIVISCRGQQITVSPRRFQFNDKCKSIG